MTSGARRRSLRVRVTIWFTAALVAALAAFAAVVYVSVRRVLWAELDDRLHHEVETVEGLLQPYWTMGGVRTPGGISPLDDDDDRWVEVWTRDSRLLFQSDVAKAAPLPQVAPPQGNRALSIRPDGQGHLRMKDELGHIAQQPVVLRVVTSEARVRNELTEMLLLMAVALPLCALTAAYGGHRLARRTLAPIDRLVRAANGITAENLTERLPVEHPADEVGQIAQAFNATLTRLQASFTQMRRFTANASHELRTPLTALRSTGQVALTSAGSIDDHREAIGSMLEEVERLSKLLETLLLLARSDAERMVLSRHSVDLLDLVQEMASECRVLAEEKSQSIAIDGSEVVLSADPTVLRIAIANVIHNAIRYSPSNGLVSIRVESQGDTATIEVADQGDGIPPAHLDQIFERFYQIDSARSPGTDGVGLGLAMARWAVEAHHGTITVRNNPAAGSTFTISLPLAVVAQPPSLNM
jgi:heavy metal sensor kinase